jgi:type II secretory pathway component PulK
MGISLSDPLITFLPFINTGLMRMMVAGGDLDEEEVQDYAQTGEVSEEVAAASREGGSRFSKKNFLDFDGDFSVKATGEDCKINISGLSTHAEALIDDPIYKMLDSLMSGEDNDQWLRDRGLQPIELIGNLADWVDSDSDVASGNGSYEDNFYNRQASPYLAKNAPFDSPEEIRLVEGWQDEVYERWGDKLTIYGSKKINITCTDDEIVKMMLRAWGGVTTDADAERVLQAIQEYKNEGFAIGSCGDFKRVVSERAGITMADDFLNNCTNKNTVYTVTSTGSVGDVLVTITAVVDQADSDAGRIKYWRVD